MNQQSDDMQKVDDMEQQQSDGSTAATDDVLMQNEETQNGEAEAEQVEQVAQAKTGVVRKTCSCLLPILIASLMVLVIAAAGGYFLWQDGKLQRLALQREMQDLIASRERQWAERQQQNSDALRALEQKQDEMRNSITRVHEMASRNSDDWALAEVEYLLLIANHRLQLQQDVKTSLAALQLADARLRDMANPGMTNVRGEIKSEIGSLKAYSLPDYNGLSLELAALSRKVAELKLRTASPLEYEQKVGKTAAMQGIDKTDWREVLGGLWDELKVLVVVRKRDHEILPMMTPEQEQMVRQGLRLKFEAGRIQALQQDQQGFIASLDGARNWLQDYFDLEDEGVAAMLQSIRSLHETQLQVNVPDISGSLSELRAAMQASE